MSRLWPPERIDKVRELAALGLSSTEMGAELGCSRNAVIGICRRQRIELRGYLDGASERPQRPKPQPRRPAPFRRPSLLPAINAKAPPLAAAEPAGAHQCGILELRNKSCRWPITAEPPHRFCGEPAADLAGGCPYCPYHARRAISRSNDFPTRPPVGSLDRGGGRDSGTTVGPDPVPARSERCEG